MSKREDTAVIRDMKEAIDRIILYTSGIQYADFLHILVPKLSLGTLAPEALPPVRKNGNLLNTFVFKPDYQHCGAEQ